MNEQNLEMFRKMIRDKGRKITPEILFHSALEFCQQSLDFPGSWEGKAEVMSKVTKSFPLIWGPFVEDDSQSMAMLTFLTHEMALAFRFMSVMAALEDAGEVISAEQRYLIDRIMHYETLESEEAGCTKDTLTLEMLFLQPFFKRFHEEIVKDDVSLLFGCATLNSACQTLSGLDDNGNQSEQYFDHISRLQRAKGILSRFKPREAYSSTSC